MERLNIEAIPRSALVSALKDRHLVPTMRRIDRCLLCRRAGVNEAALCGVCWSLLDDGEMRQAMRWLNGAEP